MKIDTTPIQRAASTAIASLLLVSGVASPAQASQASQLVQQEVQNNIGITLGQAQRRGGMQESLIGNQEHAEQNACNDAQQLEDTRVNNTFYGWNAQYARQRAQEQIQEKYDELRNNDGSIRDQEKAQVDDTWQTAEAQLQALSQETPSAVNLGNPYTAAARITREEDSIMAKAGEQAARIMVGADNRIHVLLNQIDPLI